MARKFLGGKPVVGTGSDEVVVETLTITATDPVLIDNTTSADLSANRTISVKAANTSGQAGVVSLTDSTSTTSSTVAATATAVKAAYDASTTKVPTTRTISTTSPITGGGDLSTDRTIAINDGTTAQKGAVQLEDSTSSTSTTTAATPNSVKSAYDLANAAIAKSVVTTIGDLIIGAGTPAVPTRLAIGATSGSVLTSNGTTASWSAAPTLTNATIATPTLTLSTTTSNTEGRIAWDATNDYLSVGTGTAQATFVPASLPSIVATFSKSGTLATGTGTFRWYNDSGKTLTIGTVRASVGTAPTGASLIVDVNVSASGAAPATIYSTQANRPTIAASAFTATGSTKSTTTIANTDYLTVDIDQVGSTVAGSDLTVLIWLSYA